MTIQIGDKLPAISVATTENEKLKLSSLKGVKVVLYFYPKDNTPGCTKQGQDFRDHYRAFKKLNTVILGCSRESIKSHQNFINKYEFPFALISDPDEALCNLFGVIKEKNMYGRKFMGIERSTFIFDEKGKLRHQLRKVKVKDHIEEVLSLLREL